MLAHHDSAVRTEASTSSMASTKQLRVLGAGGAQQVEPRRVAVVDLVAEAAHEVDLRRLISSAVNGIRLRAQHAADDLAEAAEAGDDHRGSSARRWLSKAPRRRAGRASASSQRVQREQQRRRAPSTASTTSTSRSRDRRDRAGRAARRAPNSTKANSPPRGERDAKRRAPSAAAARRARPMSEQDQHLDARAAQRRARARPAARVAAAPRLRRHADGDEEQAEQQALERLDVGLELVAVLGVGEQHAGEEGAERHRQPGALHQQRGADHEQQRRRREHLAHSGCRRRRAAPGARRTRPPRRSRRRRSGRRSCRAQRARRAAAAASSRRQQRQQRQHRDHREVLEQQDGERGAAVRGRRAARARPASAGRSRSTTAPAPKPMTAAVAGGCAERPGRRAQQRAARSSTCARAQAEHGAAQHPQARRLQLQADDEQQQHDAELGELRDALDVADQAEAPRADRRSRRRGSRGSRPRRSRRNSDTATTAAASRIAVSGRVTMAWGILAGMGRTDQPPSASAAGFRAAAASAACVGAARVRSRPGANAQRRMLRSFSEIRGLPCSPKSAKHFWLAR